MFYLKIQTDTQCPGAVKGIGTLIVEAERAVDARRINHWRESAIAGDSGHVVERQRESHRIQVAVLGNGNLPTKCDVVYVHIVAAFQPVVGNVARGDFLVGCLFQHIVEGQRGNVHIGEARAVVDFVAEGTVGLQGDVEILVAERDVRSQQHFRRGLAGNIGTVVLIYSCAVAVHLESGEVRHVEHTQRLSDSLEHHVVVAVESGTVHRGNSSHRGCQHLFAFIVAGQREQLVLWQRQVGIDGQHHVAGDERCAAE